MREARFRAWNGSQMQYASLNDIVVENEGYYYRFSDSPIMTITTSR